MKNIIKICTAFLVLFALGCNNEEDQDVTPANAILISPLKNQSCELGIKGVNNTSRLLFQWERAKNAQSYDLIVKNLATGQNYITYTDIYDNFKELILINDVPYSWKIISRNIGTEVVGTSEEWKFFFVGEPRKNYSPFPATILSPKQSAKVNAVSGKVNLSWQGSDPDGNALKYTIFFDAVDGLQPAVQSLKNINSTSVQVDVVSGKTYFWRVQTFDGLSSSISPVYNFKVN
jgi:hypothetical protein